MELEEIRKKYQCDEGRTFAQWKEWVRKNKPSQARAHIVKAVAPNGSKYEWLIGGYTDAQNTAFDLVSHGYKDVKLYHSVNAGPLKLLRNFSAPLRGAKFKDSDVSTDAQDDKKFFFQVFTRNGKLISKIKAPDTISTSIATRLAEQESKKFKKNWYKCQIVDQNGRSYETYYNKVPSYNGTRELAAKNMDSVDEIRKKYQEDKLSITSNGFANGSGVLKKDTRKGLKPFEVAFFVKGKDGKPFKTVRSKMAASLEEAKRWANQESRKYNGVTKVEVKEFKDEADAVDFLRNKYANDASISQKKDQPVKVTNISIKPSPVGGFEGNVYYSKNGETDLYSPWHIMANGKWGFPFGRSSTRLTQSDKKLIEQKIKKLVSQKGVKVKDSADGVEQIRAKYSVDAASQELKVNSVYFKKDPEGNVRGDVEFERNGKYASATFGVYASGNWEIKPWMNNSALNKATPAEKAALVKAIRAKIGPLGAKLKSF